MAATPCSGTSITDLGATPKAHGPYTSGSGAPLRPAATPTRVPGVLSALSPMIQDDLFEVDHLLSAMFMHPAAAPPPKLQNAHGHAAGSALQRHQHPGSKAHTGDPPYN